MRRVRENERAWQPLIYPQKEHALNEMARWIFYIIS